MRNNLPSLSNHCSPPHLKSLPPAKPIEELQRLDFEVQLFLLRPVKQLEESLRFPAYILAKALFADGIILKMWLSFMETNILEVNQIQLVDILLRASHEVEVLVDVLSTPQDQIYIFIEFELNGLAFLSALVTTPFLVSQVYQH